MKAAALAGGRGAYFWMDVLRFGAALAVVMEHVRDLLFLTSHEASVSSAAWKAFYILTGFGHEAVMVFFVLSGFWISSTADRGAERPHFWPRYLIDRLSRLMIVAVPALVLGGLLDLASLGLGSSYAAGTSGALTVQHPVASQLTPTILLGNLAFLQTIAVPTFGSNGPLWSLANEFWYYLWFPALLLTFRRRRPSPALLALGIAVVSPSLLTGFAVWLMGAALYYLDRRSQASRWGWRRTLGMGIPAASALAGALIASRLQKLPDGGEVILGAAFSAALWVILRASPPAWRAARPFARFGASASFSLYAVHLPLVVLLASLLPPGQRTAPEPARLAQFAAILLVTLACAYAFSRLTEARTGALRGRLARALLPAAPQS